MINELLNRFEAGERVAWIDANGNVRKGIVDNTYEDEKGLVRVRVALPPEYDLFAYPTINRVGKVYPAGGSSYVSVCH